MKTIIKAVTAAALATIVTVASPAAATSVWLNYSGTGYTVSSPRISFSFTTFYDPAIIGSAAQVSNAFLTISNQNYPAPLYPARAYAIGEGSGESSITGTGFINIRQGSEVLNVVAGNSTGRFELTFGINSDGSSLNSSYVSNGVGTYSAGGSRFFLEHVMIESVTAVPEPLTWAMMILGMGMVGAALRRRKKVTNKAAFAV